MDRGRGLGDAGSPVGDSPLAGSATERIVSIRREQSFETRASRSTGTPLRIRLDEHRPDEVVELELDGGVKLYTTLGDYLQDASEAPRGRDLNRLEAGEVLLPLFLPLGGPRGRDEWATERLKILDIGLEGLARFAGETAGEKVCAWYEARQLYGGTAEDRLWRCSADRFALSESADSALEGPEPLLLLIHGTASSTHGSFGQLWHSEKREIGETRAKLFGRYPERVFAFEHRSLTRSPISNALHLVDALPEGARLHLITHSRGGLIGELLCLGMRSGEECITADEIRRFFADRPGDRTELQQLGRHLREKALKIERFVRVGCPARGTTLASGRLDRWLSVALHLVGQVPALKISGFYDLFAEFTKAFVTTRTKPDKLPGLEAMMPDSPLIRLLNFPGVEVAADLHVIAGDIEGGSLWRRLGVLLTDLFYTFEDHDLIVNTAAMDGGAARSGGARYLFRQGPDIFHFNYFGNPEIVGKLLPALTEQAAGDGFEPLSPAEKRSSRAVPMTVGRAARSRRPSGPTVFLLPGLMASELSVSAPGHEAERIWLDAKQLALGRIAELAIRSRNVVASGLIESAYGLLMDYLEPYVRVVPFPYDWRLPLDAEATRLAAAIDDCLDSHRAAPQPVCLLAHSSGGLLARWMIARRPALWDRMLAHPQSRLVMLGTPNGGSYSVLRMLLGRDPMLQGLALVDAEHTLVEWLEFFSGCPGLLALLPAASDGLDCFDPSFWQHLRNADRDGLAPRPDAAALAEARAVREVLDRQTPRAERLVYVAGCAPETPGRVLIGEGRNAIVPRDWMPPPESDPIQFEASRRGDGRVLWDSGIPEWIRNRYYLDAAHGDLLAHPPAFAAILELLQTGRTDQLRTSEPAVDDRGAPLLDVGTARMRSRKPQMLPSQRQIEDAVLARFPRRGGNPGTRIKVGVVHGNLAFARHLVMVGHYQGDTIISAEAQIDHRLNGQLSRRNRLGLYPGPLNTSQLFREQEDIFPGAIVVGLGKVGELKPGSLRDTFCRALVDYALTTLEQDRGGEPQVQTFRELSVSSLLIGTTAGGVSTRDAVSALLRGMLRANDALRQWKLDETVRFAAIEFVELYQDLAIQAAAKINEAIGADPDLNAAFEPVPGIESRDGGRVRVSFEEAPGWWDRLQIVADDQGQLRFTALTDRARTEVSLLPTQRALVDQFLDQALAGTASDQSVTATLFELLLPNDLKEHSLEQRDLVLILDDAAACYPWELMYDGLGRPGGGPRVDERHAPLAIQAGMIRQRETEDFRRRVVATRVPNVLIVGDPDLSDPGTSIRSLFPQLDGAREEAEQIANLLSERQGAEHVFRTINERCDRIVGELFARPYRMLHLAGHGAYRFAPLRRASGDEAAGAEAARNGGYGNAPVSGMVIGRRSERTVEGESCERYILLTPFEIEQMRFVPEMVFVNCCFGGMDRAHTDPVARRDRHRLAANIATQLIRMGVRAVIAAGWEVDDRAAVTFARTYYQAMLDGERFGYAVQRARKKTFLEHPTVNTWGAYQCYGDPDFRLFTDGPRNEPPAGRPRSGLAEAELVAALDNLAGDAKTADTEVRRQELRELLRELERRARGRPVSGRLAAALGRACGEMDQFPEAVWYYQQAADGGTSELSLGVLEQLANLKARWAVARFREPCTEGEAPEDLVSSAIKLLTALIQLSPTAERYRLLGSAHKRASIIAADLANCRSALQAMCQSYRTAMLLDGETPRSYAVTNWLTARFLLAFLSPDATLGEDVEKWFATLDRCREGECPDEAGFWVLSERGDRLNVRYLLGGTLNEHQGEVIAAYRRAARRAVSPREWRSVVEHFEFLIDVLERLRVAADDPAAKARAEQSVAVLKPMLAELKRME